MITLLFRLIKQFTGKDIWDIIPWNFGVSDIITASNCMIAAFLFDFGVRIYADATWKLTGIYINSLILYLAALFGMVMDILRMPVCGMMIFLGIVLYIKAAVYYIRRGIKEIRQKNK